MEEFVEDLSNWYVRRGPPPLLEERRGRRQAGGPTPPCSNAWRRSRGFSRPSSHSLPRGIYGNLAQPAGGGQGERTPGVVPRGRRGPDRRGPVTGDPDRHEAVEPRQAARSQAGIKVRQPLARALVKLRSADEEAALERVSPRYATSSTGRSSPCSTTRAWCRASDVRADMSEDRAQVRAQDAGGPRDSVGGGPERGRAPSPGGQPRDCGRVHPGAGRDRGNQRRDGRVRSCVRGRLHGRGAHRRSAGSFVSRATLGSWCTWCRTCAARRASTSPTR